MSNLFVTKIQFTSQIQDCLIENGILLFKYISFGFTQIQDNISGSNLFSQREMSSQLWRTQQKVMVLAAQYYNGDLKNGLVQYSNGEFVSDAEWH